MIICTNPQIYALKIIASHGVAKAAPSFSFAVMSLGSVSPRFGVMFFGEGEAPAEQIKLRHFTNWQTNQAWVQLWERLCKRA